MGTFGGGNDFFKAWELLRMRPAPRASSTSVSTTVSTCSDSADVYSDGLAEQILGTAIKGRSAIAC